MAADPIRSLFDQPPEDPFPAVETVTGKTIADLLGDAGPIHDTGLGEPENVETPATAAVLLSVPRPLDRCPSCGVSLPHPTHLVDAASRETTV